MKITALLYRPKFNDFIGHGVLTEPVEMSTGYRGRGLVGLLHTFPVGTPVRVYIRDGYGEQKGQKRVELEIQNIVVSSRTPNYGARSDFSTNKTEGDYAAFVEKFKENHPEKNNENAEFIVDGGAFDKARMTAWQAESEFARTYTAADKGV